LVRIFTRSDGWQELLTTIRHVCAMGQLPEGEKGEVFSDRDYPVDNTLGGVIKLIEEVLDDYETTRPTTAYTDEAIAKRGALGHRNP